jgi:hypothetical protein
MIKAPGAVAADWESLWASLTFELASPTFVAARHTGEERNPACRNKIVATVMQAQP